MQSTDSIYLWKTKDSLGQQHPYRAGEFDAADFPTFFTSDNNILKFNDQPGKYNGINYGTMYEEFFHAGQDNYYSGENTVRDEVEAKVATVYSMYKIMSDISSDPNKMQAALSSLGMDSRQISTLLRYDNTEHSFKYVDAVKNYFDLLSTGKSISQTDETNFRKSLRQYGKDLYYIYHYSNIMPEDVENYDGRTNFWDSMRDSYTGPKNK